jgi:hypothetical protein
MKALFNYGYQRTEKGEVWKDFSTLIDAENQ